MSGYVTSATEAHLGGNHHHGDLSCISLSMWRTLVDRFAVRSMLDVGCGEGQAVHFFHKLGVFSHGIDGLDINVKRAVCPIALHDLTKSPYIMPVDLVLSIEVAEHIEEKYLDNYLTTLANGRIVVMTHALPGQAGYHHVNCQPPEYWISHMSQRGYALDGHNKYWRHISNIDHHPTHFGNSGLVFLRKN